jgi:hypothetical protein
MVKRKRSVYHFNYTCKCSNSLNRFWPELTITRLRQGGHCGARGLNTYIHFKVLTQIYPITGEYGKSKFQSQHPLLRFKCLACRCIVWWPRTGIPVYSIMATGNFPSHLALTTLIITVA